MKPMNTPVVELGDFSHDKPNPRRGPIGTSTVSISVIVPTVSRVTELARLLDSLLDQEFQNFEVLVVDQNRDDRIVPVLERYQSRLTISRIPTPTRRGASAARNDGWRRAHGEIFLFPDDDCWYPPWFLRKGLELLDMTGADHVSGRTADETGRSINGRFASRPQFVTRRSVWTTVQAEPFGFYRRSLLDRVGGFDEGVGIGSASPWQAAEAPDFILTALERGCVCYYDPSLYGFHREYDLDDPVGRMVERGRMYGRGMGYVLRRHKFGILGLLHWASRPLITVLTSVGTGRFHRAAYSLSVSLGRIEGYTGHLWAVGRFRILDRSYKATDGAWRSFLGSRDEDAGIIFHKQRREMTGPYRASNLFLVAFLRAADAIGRFLPRRQKDIPENRPLRVLIANWAHLGDVVTILPLLKFLESHPRVGELGVLIASWSRPVLESSDVAARIHVIDHWALDRSDKSTLRKLLRYVGMRHSLVKELRDCQYDISIDTFSTFPSSHGVTWGASIPRRIGFKSGGLGCCLTDPFSWIPDDRLMIDHQLELLELILGDRFPKTLAASYPGFDVTPRLVGTDRYIVIHMGQKNFRQWVPEKWLALAAALKDKYKHYELVATGGAGDEVVAARELGSKIPIRNLTGRLSWEQFVATLAHAAAVVTIDSVTGHVAACFGVPTVILAAGRQRLNLWSPNNPNAVMLTHQVGCAPCHRANGCDVMACLRPIGVTDVLSALQTVWDLPAAEPKSQRFTMVHEHD
jgi:ADP-heptose:LPS heptosyltransferase/glycosyltransferase involved in cell wall biosynthesis